jgi:hypothetical protein
MIMNILLSIGVFILIIVFLMKFAPSLFKNGGAKNTSRPLLGSKPNQEITNDKLVIVDKISYEDVKKAITGFCNLYNQKDWAALPKLIKLGDSKFAITFPYDVEFEIFCYFINYMAYPEGLGISPEVIAWTTTNPKDNWIAAQAADKKTMFFLPENDTWYDFVLMTTEDNIGYKLGFALGEQKQLPTMPEKRFIAPKLNIAQLSSMTGEDFC